MQSRLDCTTWLLLPQPRSSSPKATKCVQASGFGLICQVDAEYPDYMQLIGCRPMTHGRPAIVVQRHNYRSFTCTTCMRVHTSWFGQPSSREQPVLDGELQLSKLQRLYLACACACCCCLACSMKPHSRGLKIYQYYGLFLVHKPLVSYTQIYLKSEMVSVIV